jgi:hypothetical protein
MKRLAMLVLLFMACRPVLCQQVVALVAPFDSSRTKSPQLGEKAAIILNLQIWQTLRIPPTADGRNSHGTVEWITFSDPPRSEADVRKLASAMADDPAMVLWGRAWHYGGGTVVVAFLLVRGQALDTSLSNNLWSVSLSPGRQLSVTAPRAEEEFAPVVIRGDLLAELEDPSGLKLYADQHGDQVKGTVGDAFRALVQAKDSAMVQLPDGAKGWVRLPNLSTSHSEVVDFTAGLIRIFRHDWPGAMELFAKVVNDPQTPAAVRVDAYLYIGLAADKMGRDSYPWMKKAYETNPYSKAVVQYLCMSRISDFNRLNPIDQRGGPGLGLLRSLHDITVVGASLFPVDDAWLNNVNEFVVKRLH